MAITQKTIDALKAADVALGARIDKEVNARVIGDGALAGRITLLEEQVKALIAAGGGGGTTPIPNEPPPPTPDITAPVISNIAITGVTTTGATVGANTNEAATVVVEYGLSTSYGTQTSATASGTTHSRNLTGLQANQTYHLRVRATDTAGNLALSSDRTFTTAQTSPTPSPTRPFAAPTITNQVAVNAGANIQSLVNAAPDGTQFNFAAGASFSLSAGILLVDRHHLRFEGNGARLVLTGSGGSTNSSGFKLDNLNRDIAIRNFVIQGNNPNTTTLYNAGTEGQHGVGIYDGQRIEIDNITVKNVYGDGVYVEGWNRIEIAPYRPSEDIWVHDSRFEFIGRMGMVFNATIDSICERCYFDRVALFVFDIESDNAWDVVDNVKFQDNEVGSYGHSPLYTNWFFACSGGSGDAEVSNVYVDRNRVNTGAPVNSPNNTSVKGGLACIVERGGRVAGVRFRDNTTTKSGAGPVLRFAHVDGLTVTGNTQPLTSGSLVSTTDVTSAVTSPNP